MWKLFRKPAPVDPEVFNPPPPPPLTVNVPGGDVYGIGNVLVRQERKVARSDILAAMLAASCADASESTEKFKQLYERAQAYLEELP